MERLGAYVVSDDGEHLGTISRGLRTEALGNRFGAGSEYKSDGLFNKFGKHGSPYAATSAFNNMATRPPEVLVKHNGDTYSVGLLTTNRMARTSGQRINPHLLKAWLESS